MGSSILAITILWSQSHGFCIFAVSELGGLFMGTWSSCLQCLVELFVALLLSCF